jgi:DNA-binding beta-propeller fold protein YncE
MTLVDSSPPSVDLEAQALIKEARDHQKRRRHWIAGAFITAIVAGAVAYVTLAQQAKPVSTPPGSGTLSEPSSSTGGGTAYLTSGPSIIPIDLVTETAGSPISVPGRVTNGIAITPDGHTAYVTTYVPTTPYLAAVVPVDLTTKTAGSPILVPGGIAAMSITPDGRTAYVTTGAPGAIVPIDLVTKTAGSPVSVPMIRPGIAITPDGHTAYVVQNVANGAASAIVPIDLVTQTAGSPISVPVGAYSIAITPNGHTAYVLVTPTSSVVPIDLATKTVGRPISVPSGAQSIAIMPGGHAAYVATIGVGNAVGGTADSGPSLVPIDLTTNTVGRPFSVPASSGGIAIAPAVAP